MVKSFWLILDIFKAAPTADCQLITFGRRVSFLAEGVKRDSEEAHLLKTVASGGPWHSEVQGEEALLTRLKDWAKSPPK